MSTVEVAVHGGVLVQRELEFRAVGVIPGLRIAVGCLKSVHNSDIGAQHRHSRFSHNILTLRRVLTMRIHEAGGPSGRRTVRPADRQTSGPGTRGSLFALPLADIIDRERREIE
jgi:hypothetical protein